MPVILKGFALHLSSRGLLEVRSRGGAAGALQSTDGLGEGLGEEGGGGGGGGGGVEGL